MPRDTRFRDGRSVVQSHVQHLDDVAPRLQNADRADVHDIIRFVRGSGLKFCLNAGGSAVAIFRAAGMFDVGGVLLVPAPGATRRPVSNILVAINSQS